MFLLLKKLLKNQQTSLLFILFFIIICSFSCARQPKVSVNIVSKEKLPSSIIDKLNSAAKINLLKAYGRLIVEYKDRYNSSEISVALEDEKLRMDVIDRLAGPLSTIIVNKDKVEFLDAVTGRKYNSEDDKVMFSRIAKVPFSFSKVINVLKGSYPKKIPLENIYNKDGKDRFWIEPGKSAVKLIDGGMEYLIFDDRKLLYKIDYLQYEEKGNLIYPKTIAINMPTKDMKMTFVYYSVEFNTEIKEGIFELR